MIIRGALPRERLLLASLASSAPAETAAAICWDDCKRQMEYLANAHWADYRDDIPTLQSGFGAPS